MKQKTTPGQNRGQKSSFKPIVNSLEDLTISKNFSATRNAGAEKLFGYNAEEAVENLRAIFDNTTQGFILMDPEGRIKLFNYNAARFGFSAGGRNMEPGKPIYDFIEESNVGFLKDAISKVLQGETIRYSRFCQGGPEMFVWLEFSVNPVFSGNQVTGICITGNDITEKKLIEQEREFDRENFESLINNTKDLMWSVDLQFRLITFNKPFEESVKTGTGVSIKKGSRVLLNRLGKPMLHQSRHFYKRAFSGESFTEIQYNEFPEATWLELSFHPIYNGEEVVGTACFSRDITQSRKDIIEKESFIMHLSQNNKDLQQFAYITSHNLRAPITNLLGLTNLLDNYKVEDETLAKILAGIKKAAHRFDETTRDLSMILTIKDNPSAPIENLSFLQSFMKAKDHCDVLIEESGANIVLDFSEASDLNFNRSYLESIFLNLLTNSLKYRDFLRPLKINIKTSTVADFIVLSFSDNGIGVDVDQHKEKIFKLYQRFHVDREGKGLGLFLIRSQLEMLGGSISIESKVHEGTCFTIQFKK